VVRARRRATSGASVDLAARLKRAHARLSGKGTSTAGAAGGRSAWRSNVVSHSARLLGSSWKIKTSPPTPFPKVHRDDACKARDHQVACLQEGDASTALTSQWGGLGVGRPFQDKMDNMLSQMVTKLELRSLLYNVTEGRSLKRPLET
jgi:hypothetical protein